MADAPAFFVPFAEPDKQEEAYADLAGWCHKDCAPIVTWDRDSVPPPGQRVYSIAFTHDGEQWTATVGEQLRGVQIKKSRVRGKQVERRIAKGDAATVLAIFPGECYVVVTNGGIGGVVSAWGNPFLAGKPYSVTRFSAV